MVDSVAFEFLLTSIFFKSDDKFSKKSSPVTEMTVSDDCVTKISKGIDDRLSEKWSADVPDVRWFPDIHSDVVDDDAFIFVETCIWFDFFLQKIFCNVSPNRVSKEKINITTSCADIFKNFSFFFHFFRKFICDFIW